MGGLMDKVMADIGRGTVASVYLLCGDELVAREGARAIVDALVPADHQALSVETISEDAEAAGSGPPASAATDRAAGTGRPGGPARAGGGGRDAPLAGGRVRPGDSRGPVRGRPLDRPAARGPRRLPGRREGMRPWAA